LDIYFTVTDDKKGIKEAIKLIKKHQPERIMIEATGRLEMPFIIACEYADFPFGTSNLIHIKQLYWGHW
jgi:transposase